MRNPVKKIALIMSSIFLSLVIFVNVKSIIHLPTVPGANTASAINSIQGGLRVGAGVFVFPPDESTGGSGTVLLPDGTEMNVSGSFTAGIQEAINYASDYGWDLFIYGKGTYSTHGVYHLSKGIKFPATQGKTIRVINATLDFGLLSSEAGITFDTGMMFDFRMTGTLLAPSTNPAVLFKPLHPFPLDAFFLGGAGGIVDSRYSFEKIIGGQSGVRFETYSMGGIGSNTFYFEQILVAPGGSGIVYQGSENLFGENILHTGDQATLGQPNLPDNLDYFNPNGVAVLPPLGNMGNPGTVILPNGQQLNVTGTQTAGIQEAINYAAANNLDLAVYGRGLQTKYIVSLTQYPNNGFYQINKDIKFPSISNKTIRFYNVTMNYGQPNISSAIQFGDVISSDVELTGQVVGSGTNVAVYLTPTSSTGIQNSRFRIGHFGSGAGAGVAFDPRLGSIKNNRFLFHEVIGNNVGIQIKAPSTTTCFCDNFVFGEHVHDISGLGVQIGQDQNNQQNINNNTFVLLLNPDDESPQVGVQIFGRQNNISVTLIGALTTTRGISFEPGSSGNAVTYTSGGSKLVAFTPIFHSPNEGANNTTTPDLSWIFNGNRAATSYYTPPPPDTTLPVVSITTPTNGSTVSGTTVAVSSNATDNVAMVGVQFKIDSANLGVEDTTSPYSTTLNSTQYANGQHTITATARDAAGNTSTATTTVSVSNTVADTTPPAVSFTSPSTGATVSGTSVSVFVTATDNVGVVGVQFKVDNVNLGGEDTSSPYSTTINSTQHTNAQHIITAVVRDVAGNTSSTLVTVTISNITTLPPSPPPPTPPPTPSPIPLPNPQPIPTPAPSPNLIPNPVPTPALTPAPIIIPPIFKTYNFGTITLKVGSKGEPVKELQRFLNEKLNLGLVLDGKIGPKTIAVIKKWQADNGLTPDGLIGPKTKAMINGKPIPTTNSSILKTTNSIKIKEKTIVINTNNETEVKKLQENLNKVLGGGYLKVNGIYDTKTINIIKYFQKENGLQNDGIYDLITQNKINLILEKIK